MKKSDIQYYKIPLKIAVGGSVNAGKSSLLGVLKSGILDNGCGSARMNIFNFPHERKTGRTSSIAQRSIYVNEKKIIFFDLAGHEKYLRTTLFGLSSSYPDIAMILIESNRGIQIMTKEHIKCAIYLRIPILFVFTKTDIAIPSKLMQNIKILKRYLKKMVGKFVCEVKNEKLFEKAFENISCDFFPLFKLSIINNHTKESKNKSSLENLKNFLTKLNNLEKSLGITKGGDSEQLDKLFIIDKSFRTEGYPLIASGIMKSGKINVGDKLFLGPFGKDEFIDITIRSIHDDDQNNVSYLRRDEMGCLAFKSKILKNKKQIKPGMIITNIKRIFTNKFIGKVNIFSNNSCTINIGYNTVIHCGCLRKSVRIYKMKSSDGKELETIRGGDKNIKIYFQFLKGKHFVVENDRFLFREGKTRGFGKIIEVLT